MLMTWLVKLIVTVIGLIVVIWMFYPKIRKPNNEETVGMIMPDRYINLESSWIKRIWIWFINN